MPDTLHICFGATLPHRHPECAAGADWAYFGLDANRREQASARLREALRRDLGEELNAAAYRILGEYRAWIAELGRAQRDPRRWWGSVTATGSPLLSDLFLFVTYLELVHTWLAGNSENCPAVIVVEDLALWRTLALALRKHPRVRFHGRAMWTQGRRGWRRAARRRLARIYFAGRAAGLLLEARLCIRREPPPQPPHVFILTPVEEVSFSEDGQLTDPFHGPLAASLERCGERVTRITGLRFRRALLPRLAPHADRVIVLPRYARCVDIVACSLARHRLRTTPRLACFRGWNVEPLLQREDAETSSRTGYLHARLMEKTMLRVAARFGSQAKALVYLAENQEWEQPMLAAWRARSPHTRLIAHKSYPMRPLLLGELPAPGECGGRTLPDATVVCGDHSRCLLVEAGVKPEAVIVGGAMRFAHLCRSEPSQPPPPARAREAGKQVAVLLPYSQAQSEMVIQELCAQLQVPLADPQGRPVRFLVKPHPLAVAAVRDRVVRAGAPWISLTGASVRQLAKQVDLVLHVPGTSAGWEAAGLGLPVIRYTTDWLDLDPFEPWRNPLPACDRRSLRDQVLAALDGRPRSAAPSREFLAELFAPPAGAMWSRALGGASAARTGAAAKASLGAPRPSFAMPDSGAAAAPAVAGGRPSTAREGPCAH